jgi:Glycosyl hydrolase family 26
VSRLYTATAPASASSRIVERSRAPSAIYWGAYEEGPQTYGYLYGDTWNTAPWDCAYSTPRCATQDRFASNAGKEPSIVHWGAGAPWDHDFNYWVGTLNLVNARGDLNLVDLQSRSAKLRDVASGLYDSSFTRWAQQAKAWGHPFFLRWDWEMNGSWFPWGTTSSNQNTPADYVAAWRHIHDLFSMAGAANVTWVWSVNAEYSATVPIQKLYPGDGYVDWTSVDGYNKSSATWWHTFRDLFASTYAHLLKIAPSKPIMIAETSSREVGGSKAAWIRDALTQLSQNFPRVNAVVWFNWRIDGDDWEIESSASSQAAFAAAVASPYYAPGGGFGNLPLLGKIKPLQ